MSGGISPRSVSVRAPGKVNLALHVGGQDERGFHPLATVFHAVSLHETVTATITDTLSVTVSGPQAAHVPVDASNLAARAAQALAARHGVDPRVQLHLAKGVPVAGGMAGGSADAAAALVACNELWGLGLDRAALLEVAAELGSDVGFPLFGGNALGLGYGNDLQTLPAAGEYHWVFAIQAVGLSTPAVFAEFDRLNAGQTLAAPQVSAGLLAALTAGNTQEIGAAMHNDLQPAALSLRPELGRVIAVAQANGAAGAMVSGSGPTVAALAPTAAIGDEIAAAWRASGLVAGVVQATGAAPGATVCG